MPETVRLAKLSEELGSRVKRIKDGVSAGLLTIYNSITLADHLYAKDLADRLLEQGLDELLVFRWEEDFKARKGWLPLSGSDLAKVLKAYAAAGVYRDGMRKFEIWQAEAPEIYVYGGDIYASWPMMSGFHPYRRVLVRLADASLGEQFTKDIVFEEADDIIIDIFRGRRRHLVEAAASYRQISLADYLKLAGRVRRYAVSLYLETGFLVQTLMPYLPIATARVAVIRSDREKGWLRRYHPGPELGYLQPYDPLYGTVYALINIAIGPQFMPWLPDYEGEEPLTILTSLTAGGERLHEEPDGAGLYQLDTLRQINALLDAFGADTFRFLTEYALGRIGEDLYLYVRPKGGRELYRHGAPPPEYVPATLLAEAWDMDGSILEPQVEGLPGPLLVLHSGSVKVGGRELEYAFTTKPKQIKAEGGIYLDESVGTGVVI
jgi:hypothetical protein